MNVWVWAINEENWPMVKENKIWAVDSRKKSEKIQIGDIIVFYVNGSSYFQGAFEVSSNWEKPTLDWPDGRETVLEVQLKEIITGFAHISLLNELKFFKNHENIGLALKASYGPSNSSNPITKDDYNKIISELKRVPNEPDQNKDPQPEIDLNDFNDNSFVPQEGSVRYHLVKSLFNDLLGPRMGPGEIIENPFDQYTLGILKSIYKSKETKNELEPNTDPSEKFLPKLEKSSNDLDFGEDNEEEKYLVDADLNPMQGARSIGLSFVVQGETPKIKICCTWGRYENVAGLPSSVWKRFPNFYISEFFSIQDKHLIIKPEEESSPFYISRTGVEIHVRTSKIKESNLWNVSIFLVNNTPFAEKQKDEHYVFQPQIRVKCDSLTKIGHLGGSYAYGASDELLFRNWNNKGRGHLCGVIWKEIDPEHHGNDQSSFSDFSWPDHDSKKIGELSNKFQKCDIRTEYLPTYTILQPDLSESSEIFEASILANMWEPSEIKSKLNSIKNNYLNWIRSQRSKITNLPSESVEQATKNLDECENIAQRIENGINLLVSDEKARLSFCFMNQVMYDKRRWDYRDGSTEDQTLKWYEFQMAFILQTLCDVIPGNNDLKKACDILWFPTGGGKTESYLGLMVFAFAYRRLIDIENYNADGGVSVLSRYTLRLLTIQQFTRSLGAILAADVRRVRNWKPENATFSDSSLNEKWKNANLWGKTRFSLGLWIGGDLTPNKFEIQGTKTTDYLNAQGALQPHYSRRKDSERRGEPAQIMDCPCCGEILAVPAEKEIQPGVRIKSLTWIIKTEKTIRELEAISDGNFSGDQISLQPPTGSPAKSFHEINVEDDQTRYVAFRVNFHSTSNRLLTDERIDSWWRFHVKNALGYSNDDEPLQCTRASRPGYFFLYRDGENKPYDFAIHCPNRNCEINRVEWLEEITSSSIAHAAKPFKKIDKTTSYIFSPIPAFTVDAQVYSRCPTVVIATADKFARLPFEPLASSLFGNVDYHDDWLGFGRGTVEGIPTRKSVQRFIPPSLIIQDELHLIEGPLGSMIGLYEMAIDILCSTNEFSPKYIASTATIKEAESQVGTIYRRETKIFPPPGISYGNNYFSKIEEDPSCLREKNGRLYLGILAPKGRLIVPVKIWASLLSTIRRIRASPELFGLDKKHKSSGFTGTIDEFVDKETDWYWTQVGYFSAIRELSIARNLYGDAILRDVRKWSPTTVSSISHRLGDAKTNSVLRFVPIEIKSTMEIFTVSVFSKNRKGELSISLYKNNPTTNQPGKLLRRARTEDRKKEIKEDENEFILEEPLKVRMGDLVWVALYNYSDLTRFQCGASNKKSRLVTTPTIQDDSIVFPSYHESSDEINSTVRVLLKTKSRELEPVNVVELSSSIESHELPEIMERLQKVPNNVDALFTTSMFGTGIDIDRLGLMTVMGQPKSTSSYIQSTGRVGRKCPGLVVTWLKAGRIRDLNHYENFVGYHRSIHRYVEPVSAAPFSEETMNLCMGPVAVAVLRNARTVGDKSIQRQWRNEEGPLFMSKHSDDDDVVALKNALLAICNSEEIASSRKMRSEDAKNVIDRTIDKWRRKAGTLSKHEESLTYQEYTMQRKADDNVVLGTPQHKIAGKSVVYENARTSLRDVETTSTMGDSGWAGNN